MNNESELSKKGKVISEPTHKALGESDSIAKTSSHESQQTIATASGEEQQQLPTEEEYQSGEIEKVTQGNKTLSDICAIRETENDEYGIHEYQLEMIAKPKIDNNANQENGDFEQTKGQPKLDLNVYYSKYSLPDFITVFIPAEDSRNGKSKNIVVEIQNRSIVKPFLCGYVNKYTGTEYLDAFTQTGPYVNKVKYQRYVSRDTQTRELKPKLV
ncbi:hypothetical protein EVAR_66194_1, partial [Eumeta japonica]